MGFKMVYKSLNGFSCISISTSWYCKAINGMDNPKCFENQKFNGIQKFLSNIEHGLLWNLFILDGCGALGCVGQIFDIFCEFLWYPL